MIIMQELYKGKSEKAKKNSFLKNHCTSTFYLQLIPLLLPTVLLLFHIPCTLAQQSVT